MKNTSKTRSGASIPCISKNEAAARSLLTREELSQMHLLPAGELVAFTYLDDNTVTYYFNPENVTEAPPELWYGAKKETMTLESGSIIDRMSVKRAAAYGYYTKERLKTMNCEPIEEPVAYTVRSDGSVVYFYDKKTSSRLPLMCVKCGKSIRFKKKLCRECYEEDLAERRIEGDAHRNAHYEMDRSRVLFFDLELTGFYDRD